MFEKKESVFVLHRRDYRETSFLVELFARETGRVCVIAKGARAAKANKTGILQPFMPLEASWRAKGELPILRSVELAGEPLRFRGDMLVSALYLNELLMRLLNRQDTCSTVFDIYHNTLIKLHEGIHEPALRTFEKYLMKELGYELPLTYEANTRELIAADRCYRFSPGNGFLRVESSIGQGSVFSGRTLLAIARDDYAEENVLRDAKRLMRQALTSLLGDKPIKTRELLGVD